MMLGMRRRVLKPGRHSGVKDGAGVFGKVHRNPSTMMSFHDISRVSTRFNQVKRTTLYTFEAFLSFLFNARATLTEACC